LGFLGVFGAQASDVYYGRVDRVIDGDTVSLLTRDYERLRVRLYGIDTPEKNQTWGPQATKALSAILAGQEVEVVVEDVDRFSRQVGIIFLDGLNVNLKMVFDGHAWVYEHYCVRWDVCQEMLKAQDQARAAGRGLWGQPEAVAPWDHRREHRKGRR
jgi:endonuclease YncB( thermonuclease family)